MTDLAKAVLSTIVYFDMFDYPLTATEIQQGLYFAAKSNRRYSIQNIMSCLREDDEVKKYIDYKDGFYFLNGRENILRTRHQRYLIGQPKWRRARWITAFLKITPFIRLIAVCNKIAYDNADDDSDIDLFIIIKPGRIWTARMIVTLITSLLGVRRHGEKIRDRACLSFYITERALNLENLAQSKTDTHFIYWISQIASILSLNEAETDFWQANNWLKQYLPNFTPYQGVDYQRQVGDGKVAGSLRIMGEKILSGGIGKRVEKSLKKYQLKKMSAKTASARWKDDTDVVVTDDVLKFHERDARAKLRRAFTKRMKTLGIETATT